MHSQRWMFTSPGGENEYKMPSVTREHYSAVLKTKSLEKSSETESGKSKWHVKVVYILIFNLYL